MNNNSVLNVATQAMFLQNIAQPFAENDTVTSDGIAEGTIRTQAGARTLPLHPLAAGAQLAFGGMYGYAGSGSVSNPLPNFATGAASCPAGYTAQQILGTYGTDYPAYSCYRVLSAVETPSFDFGGMYGYGASGNYNNPITGSMSCKSSFTAVQVLGTTNTDYPLYYCIRAHVQGAASFNGVFGYGYDQSRTIVFPNPMTGLDSCPSGSTQTAVFGTSSVDYPLNICL